MAPTFGMIRVSSSNQPRRRSHVRTNRLTRRGGRARRARGLVRRTAGDIINALLEEEADGPVGAGRYERTADREAYRAGHCELGLTTTSGQVTVKMSKLKGRASLLP